MSKITPEELTELNKQAKDIREQLLRIVSNNGGHLAPNLGVVELTLALNYSFDFGKDIVLFDVGHQSYVYKMLTGRKDRMNTLRQKGGIGPFMDPAESPYDHFISGHAGTALSAGAGLAKGNPDKRVIVVIGDASISNGHSLEALNNIGGTLENMVVILNDNEMSISKNIGAIARFCGKILHSENYIGFRDEVKRIIQKIEKANTALSALERMEISAKSFFVPLSILESLGYKYFGTIDGHNIEELTETFEKIKRIKGPIFIHARTDKGKGYPYAEENKEKFHGLAPFDPETGAVLSSSPSYSSVVGKKMVELGTKDKDVYAISAAMVKGTGLEEFFKQFPDRGVDIGIAEGHGVTFAAGLAKSGKKPYLAIYSAFIQRGFSQLIHDVSLQNLPVRFILDRAGIVGEDGKTHNGLYDMSMFMTIPNYTVFAPTCKMELERALDYSLETNDGPIVIRIPRESVFEYNIDGDFVPGKWNITYTMPSEKQTKNLFLCVGSMFREMYNIQDALERRDIGGDVVAVTCVKPLDEDFVTNILPQYDNVFILEEAYEYGGLGTYILETLNKHGISKLVHKFAIDRGTILHGKRNEILVELGLSDVSLIERIDEAINGKQK